jgi:hypothetical protein
LKSILIIIAFIKYENNAFRAKYYNNYSHRRQKLWNPNFLGIPLKNSKIAKKRDCDWIKIFQNRGKESETKIIKYISEYDAISYLSRCSAASWHDSKTRFAV